MRSLEDIFKEEISKEGIREKLGIDRQSVYQWRERMKQGKPVRVETMRDVLTKLGYKCVQVEMWGPDETNKKKK